MGLVYADIELASSEDMIRERRGELTPEQVKRESVKAMVDSGGYMLAINEHLKAQLGLPVLDHKEAELADGSRETYEIVGPVEVRFENRATSCRAMVLPGATEVLLGAIPMEDLDVLIDPKNQQLIINPENPYLPKTLLKRLAG